MNSIHLSDTAGRDSVLSIKSATRQKGILYQTPEGLIPTSSSFLKVSRDTAFETLIKRFETPEKLGQAMIDSDPEIDIESTGMPLDSLKSVWLSPDLELIYQVELTEIVFAPDGVEKSRAPLKETPGNLNAEIPIRCTGKLFPKKEIVRKFVFSKKYLITHINGLTFDFLFKLASELHASDSLMFAGAGKNGTDPIVLMDGGVPYRGFLEGRVKDNSYALILHLTNLELKEFQA